MNILISKYDKVDNNSEVENLIFELHSLKTKRNKSCHSKGRDKDQGPTSITNISIRQSPKADRVPIKLRKKIQSFIDNMELTEKSEDIELNNDLVNLINEKENEKCLDSIAKRPPPNHLPPAVKYIHQHSELYLKYQELCLSFEEAKNDVTFNCVKSFISIKNPSKIEHNIGITMIYLASFLDKTIMLSPK